MTVNEVLAAERGMPFKWGSAVDLFQFSTTTCTRSKYGMSLEGVEAWPLHSSTTRHTMSAAL